MAFTDPDQTIAPQVNLYYFTSIKQEELIKLINPTKSTMCLLDPISTSLMKGVIHVAKEPLLNIINFLLHLGHVPRHFKLAVIEPLLMNSKSDPDEI